MGQDKGPHLYEFSPSGNCLEYFAMSIGARSQSAKTYLETHFDSFATCSLAELIAHGLNALRDTLQQDKELTVENTSIGIVGLGGQGDVVETSAAAAAGEAQDKKEGVESGVIQVEQSSTTPTVLGGAGGEATTTTTTDSQRPSDGQRSAAARPAEFYKFRIIEGSDLKPYLDLMSPRDSEDGAGEPVQERPATEIAGGDAPAPAAGQSTGGEEMQTD